MKTVDELPKKWVSPTEVLIKDHRTKLKALNKHVSRVCAALMQLGCFDFRVEFANKDIVSDKVARITGLPYDCPYRHIDVHHDGYVGYFNGFGSCQFEGLTRNIETIKKDILKQE
jgi:hypothetical protein